jgi:malic enzyme
MEVRRHKLGGPVEAEAATILVGVLPRQELLGKEMLEEMAQQVVLKQAVVGAVLVLLE